MSIYLGGEAASIPTAPRSALGSLVAELTPNVEHPWHRSCETVARRNKLSLEGMCATFTRLQSVRKRIRPQHCAKRRRAARTSGRRDTRGIGALRGREYESMMLQSSRQLDAARCSSSLETKRKCAPHVTLPNDTVTPSLLPFITYMHSTHVTLDAKKMASSPRFRTAWT